MKKALIIFVRNPVLGSVKTRLAKGVGAERALKIYQRMLRHTHLITQGLDCDTWVFYADGMGKDDLWEDDRYSKALQQGGDLGERMQHAFQTLFNRGYPSVIIMGSDCMELTQDGIRAGFDALNREDVYIGPAADGGYYLLGLTGMHSRLFQAIPWSTNRVSAETVERCKEAGLRFSLAPVLHDIDDEADWRAYLSTPAARSSLVFVYNANSDLFSSVTGYVHKVLSPATYTCSLCALTHHHLGMKAEWKIIIQSLPCRSEFLHKDEFNKSYPAYNQTDLPAVLLKQDGALQPLLQATKLNSVHNMEELKQALQNQLAQHDLDHHPGI